MRILKLKCIKDEVKPKIRLSMHNNIKCLIDTGADTPVWCSDIDSLLDAFPDARKTDLKFVLTGFGGNDIEPFVEVTDVYRIPVLHLGNSANDIECHGVLLAVSRRRGMGAELIFPYTIFTKSCITINDMSETRELELKIKYDFIGTSYKPVLLNPMSADYDTKMKFYKEYCHLLDDEINGAKIVKYLQVLSQRE